MDDNDQLRQHQQHQQQQYDYEEDLNEKRPKFKNSSSSGGNGNSNENLTVIRLMKELSVALNGRGRTVDKLQTHLQELLIKLQMEEQELIKLDNNN